MNRGSRFRRLFCDPLGSAEKRRQRSPNTTHLLKDKLSDKAIIILDDTNRKDEQRIIQLWQQEFGLNAKSIFTEKGHGCDVVVWIKASRFTWQAEMQAYFNRFIGCCCIGYNYPLI